MRLSCKDSRLIRELRVNLVESLRKIVGLKMIRIKEGNVEMYDKF